jgi:hypothetical protein
MSKPLSLKGKETQDYRKGLFDKARSYGLPFRFNSSIRDLETRIKEHEARLKTVEGLTSVEDLHRSEGFSVGTNTGDTIEPAREVKQEKSPTKFKQVFVTYCGVDHSIDHGPPPGTIKLTYKRGVTVNLLQSLWAQMPKHDQEFVNKTYDQFVKYYTSEVKTGGSDFVVETKLVGLPVSMLNREAKTQLQTLREELDKDWSAIVFDIKFWKENPDKMPCRDYIEMLHLLYNLEQEGNGRTTLLKFIRDEVAAKGGKDERFRETSS